MGAACVRWILQTTALPGAVATSVKAIFKLSDEARRKVGLDSLSALKLLLKPVIAGTKVVWGISPEALRLSLPNIYALMDHSEEFYFNFWETFPAVRPRDAMDSLADALLNVYWAFPGEVESATWIAKIMGKMWMDQGTRSTQLDALFTFLLRNLRASDNGANVDRDLSTLTLLIHDSAPPFIAEQALGISAGSLKAYITERALDTFVNVTDFPEERILANHPSVLSSLERPDVHFANRDEIMAASHGRVAKSYLAYLMSLLETQMAAAPATGSARLWNKDQTQLPSFLPTACRTWATHLAAASDHANQLSRLLETFLQVHLLHWLEILSLYGRLVIAIPSLQQARDWLAVSSISPISQIITNI